MPEPEGPREPDTAEATWKSQTEEEQPSMQIALTPDELLHDGTITREAQRPCYRSRSDCYGCPRRRSSL